MLQASDEGAGVFRTTFTFLQGGRFEVAFNARSDGAAVHATRVVEVGDPSAAAAPPPPAAVTSPPPASPPPAPPATNATANGSPGAQWL